MQFLYPVYLYGLFLLIIPVVIHLFKLRRYKTSYFSNVSFLQLAQQEQRNNSRLKDLFLLLIRLLLICLLVFVFAHPQAGGSDSGILSPRKEVMVYIDQSLSMSNQGVEGSIFDEAKKMAYQVIEKQSLETRYQLLSEDFLIGSKRNLDRYELIESIQGLQLSTQRKTLHHLFDLVASSNENKAGFDTPRLLVFSDFQSDFVNPQTLEDQRLPETYLYPVYPVNRNNIFIDSCWLVEPQYHFNSRITITAQINNSGIQDYKQLPVKLFINDSLVAQETIELKAEERKLIHLGFEPFERGWQEARFQFNDYPVDFDNQFFASFEIEEVNQVCQLFKDQSNPYIDAAFEDAEHFNYFSYSITAFPDMNFNAFDCVFLSAPNSVPTAIHETLTSYVTQGGKLVLFPPAAGNQLELNKLIKSFGGSELLDLLQRPDKSRFSKEMDDFYRDISLNPDDQVGFPVFRQYFRLSPLGINCKPLLETTSGRPLMVQTKMGSGTFILASFALDENYSSLPLHPIFIPVLYYISSVKGTAAKIYSRLGSVEPYYLHQSLVTDKPFKVINADHQSELIPFQYSEPNESGVFMVLSQWEGTSGFLQASQNNEDSETIAMNYPVGESKMIYYSESELNEIVNSTQNLFLKDLNDSESVSSGILSGVKQAKLPLVKWLIIACILLLLVESLVFRIKS